MGIKASTLAVMLMVVVIYLPVLLGIIYVLYCLGRASAGIDRLAGAVEELVRRQGAAPTGPLPIGRPRVGEPAAPPSAAYVRPTVPPPVPPAGASHE